MELVRVESIDAENFLARVRYVVGPLACSVVEAEVVADERLEVGDLAFIDEDDLVVAGGEVHVVRIEPHKQKFRLSEAEQRERFGSPQWERSAFDADAETAKRLAALSESGRCLMVRHPGLPGGQTLVWLFESEGCSLDEFKALVADELAVLAEAEIVKKAVQAAIDAEARVGREVAAARVRARADDVFVNPYSFVPLPQAAAGRCSPAGHSHLHPGHLAGTLTVRWKVLSPLLQRGAVTSGDAGGPQLRPPLDSAGRPIVPGSSIKGAVRSLHETLTGSCLRVIDLAFVPSYRDQVTSGSRAGWVLGLIREVDRDGRPTSVQLTAPAAWISASALGSGLAPGDRFEISGRPNHHDFFNRLQFPDTTHAARCRTEEPAAGEYVILTTDAAARPTNMAYHCAVGALTDQRREVPTAVWDHYLRAVEGARGVDENDGERVLTEVIHPKTRDVRSLTPGRRMAPGQVIWAKPKGSTIEQIALAAVWRSTGTGPVASRIGDGFQPCADPANLCPSCRIFGAADTNGAVEGAEQRSYRGHVRFSDARAIGDVELETVTLAPMGQPRPGTGQFYLNNSQRPTKVPPQDPNAVKPSAYRQWGSDADRRTTTGRAERSRPIAGRKFYWAAEPANVKPQAAPPVARHIARGHQTNDQMVGGAQLVSAGAQFEATLHFENLSEAELGGLLMALSPALAWGGAAPIDDHGAHLAHFGVDAAGTGGDYATRLGGGKPLGLGIVAPEIVALTVERSADRYCPTPTGDAAPLSTTPGSFVRAFVASVPEPIRSTWPDLAAMLHTRHVNPERVWYPPAADWPQAGTKAFDESFKFFKQIDGSYLPNHEMVTLKQPRELDQYLPINPGGRN